MKTLSETQCIGRGELASVFAADPGRAVKVYRVGGSERWRSDLPRPGTYDVVVRKPGYDVRLRLGDGAASAPDSLRVSNAFVVRTSD